MTLVKQRIEKIMSYDINDPSSQMNFTDRICRENFWSKEYAERAIFEYKRFCVLASVSGHMVTPSQDVDRVWHTHLLYTQEYWENFCPKFLGMRLHHGPTKGGSSENTKFEDAYLNTIASYIWFFQSPPPNDIWPSCEDRFSTNYVTVESHSHMIINTNDYPKLTYLFKKILWLFG